jgi:hypothetical protein
VTDGQCVGRMSCLVLLAHAAVVLQTALVVGCTPGGPIFYPVRGRVAVDGKPLGEALVVLHPLAGSAASSQRPVALTDSGGHFSLTTIRSGDGAPPGEYAITVELRAARMVGEELVRDGRNLLPLRYGRPDQSGLKCQVFAGDNELPVIELKSK